MDSRATTLDDALAAFHPQNFGFAARTDGVDAWINVLPDARRVCFSTLSWQHASHVLPWREADGTISTISYLDVITRIQIMVWGMAPKDTLPPIDMAIVEDTGGWLGVAYDCNEGFSQDGWLGYVLGFGGNQGVLSSHMAGVRLGQRSSGIGQRLKLLQAYHALKTGHHSMEWTFDPMRGHNAGLNFRKLGAFASRYIVNKYGSFQSALYGAVPSDRFVMTWQLIAPQTHQFLHALWGGKVQPRTLADVTAIPDVTVETVETVVADQVPVVRFEIPGDVDALTEDDPGRATQWRRDLRTVCTRLLDAKQPHVVDDSQHDPVLLQVEYTKGAYVVTDFVTGFENNRRRSFYIFSLRG